MSFLLQNCRAAVRLFSSLVSIDSREVHLSTKFSLETVVYGYDHKNTHYKSKIKPKWSYGDDACFVANNEESCVIGVADGVGGWRTYGINPSKFPRAFMKMCERNVKRGEVKPNQPLKLAKFSYYDVTHVKNPMEGSATFCILSLCCTTGNLYSANLGDSGYLIIRNCQVVAQSIQQKHSFNTPFQIALLPTMIDDSRFHEDNPEDAHQSSFKMQQGDLIVLGTDGLFENLPVKVILQEVSIVQSQSIQNRELLQKCAQRLVDKAHQNSLTPDYISPFACEARSHGIDFKGGNPGDITVVLGYVKVEEIKEEYDNNTNSLFSHFHTSASSSSASSMKSSQSTNIMKHYDCSILPQLTSSSIISNDI